MPRQKTTRILAIALGTICLLVVAWLFIYNHGTVLELNHWPKLAVTDGQRNGTHVVHLSGGIMDSGLAITNVSTRREGSHIVVRVHAFLTQAGFGNKGDLEYDVIVPDDVNEIRFGNQENIIWRRGQNSI